MAFHLYEDTWETTLTTGAGDYALGGAVAGWRAFSAQYADGDTTWYSAFDGVNFEHGIATFHAPPTNTLTRGTVLRSTNGGAAVAWGAGVKQITVAPLGAMLEKLNPPISAQMLDIDPLRLAALGTKLKGLAPLTILNAVSATTINAALDGAVNIYQGTAGDCVWNLPPVQPGMCLNIMLGNMQHNCIIIPNAADQITGPPNTGYTQSSPLTIPPCLNGNYSSITFVAAPHNWLMQAIGPPIAEVMGWVSRPYLEASYSGSTTFTPNVWLKAGLDVVDHDSHGWWSASNTRYIPQRKGVYRTCAQAILGDTTSKQCIQVMVSNALNGNLIRGHGAYWNGVNYLPSQNSVIVVDDISCNGTTDYIEPYVYCSANVPQFIGGTALNIEYLGP